MSSLADLSARPSGTSPFLFTHGPYTNNFSEWVNYAIKISKNKPRAPPVSLRWINGNRVFGVGVWGGKVYTQIPLPQHDKNAFFISHLYDGFNMKDYIFELIYSTQTCVKFLDSYTPKRNWCVRLNITRIVRRSVRHIGKPKVCYK